MIRSFVFLVTALMFLATGCGSSDSSISVYTVGGTISGLQGDGLVLQNNGSDDLAVAGVSFEFETALKNGSSYNVTVLTQPTGQSCEVGNGSGTISGSNVTDVLLTCRGWGSAEVIENDSGNAYDPQIAVDSSGNALAAWYQSDDTRFNIWSNRYIVGSGWGTAELIETNNAGDAQSPQVAVDTAGNAITVWQQSDGTRFNIWSNRYTAGGGWGQAELIETDNAGDAQSPQIAVDAAGNVIAVWQQPDDTRFNIWSNRYIAGSGWSVAEEIETDTGLASFPQIAVDATGNAIAVWQQYDGSSWLIYSNRYIAGSGWDFAEVISHTGTTAVWPEIAIDAAGNALAVWSQQTANWSNRYTAGVGWGLAEKIENDHIGDPRFPLSNVSFPKISFDAAGNALAVWAQINPVFGDINIWSNRFTTSSGWGSAEVIEIDSGNAYDPQIAVYSSGNALAVWYQSDNVEFNIWANRFE